MRNGTGAAPRPLIAVFLAVALTAPLDSLVAQTVVTRGTNLSADVSRVDGSLVTDLLGDLWLLPAAGGEATLLVESLLPATRPRWSPDGREIVYQASAGPTSEIWLVDVESARQRPLRQSGAASAASYDRHPAWHPDGDRIVFSSRRRDTGFDIWEADLRTGLQWRLTDHSGEETEPAWSSNGRDLVYILKDGDQWMLMLRRFGQPDIAIVQAALPLASPSWRPDGTLITYFRQVDDAYTLQMVILSDPPLERMLAKSEDFFLAPVSWQDRERLFYAADGRIKSRGFDDWLGQPVPFRAAVGAPATQPTMTIANRTLPLETPGKGRLVLRAGRLFDGLSQSYRNDVDVLIEDGLIRDITSRREWQNENVIDLAGTTLLPGFIDAYSRLPDPAQRSSGAALLCWGITTLVSRDSSSADTAHWEGEDYPGPRLLRAIDLETPQTGQTGADNDAAAFLVVATSLGDDEQNERQRVRDWQSRGTPVLAESWAIGLRLGASLILGADAPPQSPLGNQYQDVRGAPLSKPLALVSGLADAGTPGLSQLYRVRQAALQPTVATATRRLSSVPDLRRNSGRIVAGSRPNRLPAGLALHAELRALTASGLAGDQVLKAAGINAARILGLSGQIGEISVGARADLILVSGDPLKNVADLVNIVAVVRNGRFYSVASLIERVKDGAGGSVE